MAEEHGTVEDDLSSLHDIKYIGDDDYIKTSQLINEVEKMLSSLKYTLRFPRSAKKSEMKTY